MPRLPWSTVSTPQSRTDLVVMASRLPLRSYRHIPTFLGWALKIRRQLASAQGLVGYALDADITAKTFWTLSAWSGQDAIDRFVRLDPHRTGMAAIRPHMLPSTFVLWSVRAGDVPIDWHEGKDRVSEEEIRRDGSETASRQSGS